MNKQNNFVFFLFNICMQCHYVIYYKMKNSDKTSNRLSLLLSCKTIIEQLFIEHFKQIAYVCFINYKLIISP